MWWRKRDTTKMEAQPGEGVSKFQVLMTGYQHKLAGWLQVQSEKLSVRAKKMILIAGGLFMAAFMLFQITNSLNGNLLPESGTIIKPDFPVPEQPSEKERIRAWNDYLDSLSRTPEGRLKLDSMQKSHEVRKNNAR